MADQKLTALSALSALTGDDLLYAVDDVAGTPTSYKVTAAVVREFSNMTQATGTDADTTMAVNTLYVVDMSAWATADRTYTLPATAAVGDRIGVMVTAGDASHELILTAGSGDTLNGIAGGTEWSRVFITGEVVVMRCIVANTTWIVEYDGRIPSICRIYRSADVATTATTTQTTPLNTLDTTLDRGDLDDLANNAIKVRRAGYYDISTELSVGSVPAGTFIVGYYAKNGTTERATNFYRNSSGSTLTGYLPGTFQEYLAVDDSITSQYLAESATSKNILGGNDAATSDLCLLEILP